MMNSIICAAGCAAAGSKDGELERARKLVRQAPRVILGDGYGGTARTAPNAVEEFHDLRHVSTITPSTLGWRSRKGGGDMAD